MIDFQNSIGSRLLKKVFPVYLLVAIIVTFIQCYIEYRDTKIDLYHELSDLTKTFAPGISAQVWDYDQAGVESILFGLREIEAVIGVEVTDQNGKLIGSVGKVPKDLHHSSKFTDYKNLTVKYPLTYQDATKKTYPLGTVFVYSTSQIVINRIKYGFFLIIINSLIKTAALWIILLYFIKKMISQPLTHFTSKVGTFTVEDRHRSNLAEEFERRDDEIGILFEKYTQMEHRISEKISIIENQREEIRALAKEKSDHLTTVMNHIPLGIFSIKPDLSIHPEFSIHTSHLLGPEFHKKNIIDLIFKVSLEGDALEQAYESLLHSFDEEKASFILNKHHLPNEIRIDERIITITWARIERSPEPNMILVILKDETQLRNLEKQRVKNEKEVEIIEQIVKESSGSIANFVTNTSDLLSENERLIRSNQSWDANIIKIIFINYHTIKALARRFHFRDLADRIAEAESRCMKALKDKNLWTQQDFHQDFSSVAQCLEEYQYLCQEKLGININEEDDDKWISEAPHYIDMIRKLPSSIRNYLIEIESFFHKSYYQPCSPLLKDLCQEASRLARNLGKRDPDVNIIEQSIYLSPKGVKLFDKIIGHLLRNSIDHGIEDEELRTHQGKSPQGTITLSLVNKGQQLLFSYYDDGNGLDLDLLLQLNKLSERELTSPQQVAESIFTPTISTAPSLSDISGRGMGMGAVKEYLEQYGCSISVKFREDTPSLESRGAPFYLEMTLPGDLYSQYAPGESS